MEKHARSVENFNRLLKKSKITENVILSAANNLAFPGAEILHLVQDDGIGCFSTAC